jgi:hypothetical protein
VTAYFFLILDVHQELSFFIYFCFVIKYIDFLVDLMVINATFNNISAILWQSALLVEETEVPGENTDLS